MSAYDSEHGPADLPEDPGVAAIDDILAERAKQKELTFGGKTSSDFDKSNSPNDWVGYVSTYLGRCTSAARNQREGQDFRTNMVKAAAIAMAAVEAYDRGWVQANTKKEA